MRRLQKGTMLSVFDEYPSYSQPQKRVGKGDTASRKRQASALHGTPAPKDELLKVKERCLNCSPIPPRLIRFTLF